MRNTILAILSRLVVVCAVASCAAWGVRVIGGPDNGVEEAIDVAVEQWPDVADVASRLDVMVVDDLDTVSRCGRSRATDVTSCLAWPGSDLARARIFVERGEDIPAAVLHELQHAHLYDDEATNACETHAADCGWVDVDTPSRK